jgi:hypothetical protein
MNITIVNVDVTTPAGKKYQQAEVVFKDDTGRVNTKKIMSFANPAVFAAMKDATSGQVYTITQVKNDRGYWDWTAASVGGNSAPAQAASSPAPRQASPAPSGRDFETKEERALRQRLIVRQSSLSNAISMLTPGSKQALAVGDVIQLAEELNAWVFKEPDLFFETENDLDKDIPY